MAANPARRAGPANQKGLDFYRRLVEGLLEREIEPLATLYHWDLPQALEDDGGWADRAVVDRFAEYAEIVFDGLGDLVSSWVTHNEPWVTSFLGYAYGTKAPGVTEWAKAVAASHHALLAHGAAVRALRERSPEQRIGITLNLTVARAASSSAKDEAAAQRLDGHHNRWFLDALFRGSYPDDILSLYEHRAGPLDVIHEGDLELISQPIDFLGINFYRPNLVANDPGNSVLELREVETDAEQTAMGWPVIPEALTELLVRVKRDYGDLPLLITENGAAFDDILDGGGVVEDPRRLAYIKAHLQAVAEAIAEGVDVRGYYVWSLLDNFEWEHGYSKRFGIVYIDYASQRRVPKRSALWYRDLIAQQTNGRAGSHHSFFPFSGPPSRAARWGVQVAPIALAIGAPSAQSLWCPSDPEARKQYMEGALAMAEIEYQALTKTFPDGTVAVDAVDLEIPDGDFVVLVGPSGSGKTTVLRMTAGLEDVTSGEILIGGKPVNDVAPMDRNIAMVFQNYALYPHMSVYDNMAFGLKLHKMKKAEIKPRVESAARMLGIDDLLKRKPAQLSGGQRQRVAMGRAIVREPDAFLMDEPLSNLDAKLRVEMRAYVAMLHQQLGTTTLYVTHDQTEAMTMGDRVAVMRSGRLEQCDIPQRLYDQPANMFVAAFIGSPSMNLVHSRLTSEHEDVHAHVGNTELRVPPQVLDRRPRLRDYVGKEIILGIRPEDIEDAAFVPATTDSANLEVHVLLAESMGAEVIAHFSLGPEQAADTTILAAPSDVSAAAEENRYLQVVARDQGGPSLTARLNRARQLRRGCR